MYAQIPHWEQYEIVFLKILRNISKIARLVRIRQFTVILDPHLLQL